MKTFLIALAAIAFGILGLIGLLVPVLPGFVFLLLSAACCARLSPTLRSRLHRQPRVGRFLSRIESTTHLTLAARAKMAFWAGLEAVSPKRV